MRESEITLIETLAMLDGFAPIKISLNGIMLYNDYDSEVEVEPGVYNGIEVKSGVYGEILPWQEVVPKRLWQFKDYIITDINVKIVDYHHSIISMRGRYEPYKKDEDEC